MRTFLPLSALALVLVGCKPAQQPDTDPIKQATGMDSAQLDAWLGALRDSPRIVILEEQLAKARADGDTAVERQLRAALESARHPDTTATR